LKENAESVELIWGSATAAVKTGKSKENAASEWAFCVAARTVQSFCCETGAGTDE